jgi:hypothetical protein
MWRRPPRLHHVEAVQRRRNGQQITLSATALPPPATFVAASHDAAHVPDEISSTAPQSAARESDGLATSCAVQISPPHPESIHPCARSSARSRSAPSHSALLADAPRVALPCPTADIRNYIPPASARAVSTSAPWQGAFPLPRPVQIPLRFLNRSDTDAPEPRQRTTFRADAMSAVPPTAPRWLMRSPAAID